MDQGKKISMTLWPHHPVSVQVYRCVNYPIYIYQWKTLFKVHPSVHFVYLSIFGLLSVLPFFQSGTLDGIPTTILEAFPALSALCDRIENEPKVVEYYKQRSA